MTPEQMRELADELDKYVGSPTRASYYPSPVLRAADFLRQCAEQRPDGWKLVPVEPTPEMLSAVGMMDGYDWHAPGCSPDADHANWYSAMIAAAPAAPQAEQPIDLDAVAMQQMRQAAAESTWMPAEYSGSDWISDVCRWLRDGPPQAEPKRELTAGERDVLDSALRSSVRLVARGVAEPKREPLTYEQLVSACYTYRHDFGLLDPDEQHLVIEEAGRWAKAFGIGGSDAE